MKIQEKASRIPHNIWSSVGNDLMDVKAGVIKGSIITQTYMLQSIGAKYDKNLSLKCIICKMDEEEDLRHFLLTCGSLQNVREKHLRKTKTYLDNIKLGIYSKLKEEGYLLQLIMDCTHNTLNFESVMKRYYYIET